MCSRYETPLRQLLQSSYPTAAMPGAWDKPEIWPKYHGPFVRRPEHHDVGDEAVPELEVEAGQFGMRAPGVPADSPYPTYNARSETVATKPSFRNAWRKAQHCIIPAVAIYEPDWRSGKHVPTRITSADGELLGIAGLWEEWTDRGGEKVRSYTMLTINADTHPIFKELHRPDPKRPPEMQDKRMVVILPRRLYLPWLDAKPEESMDLLRQFPADHLLARAEPKQPKSEEAK